MSSLDLTPNAKLHSVASLPALPPEYLTSLCESRRQREAVWYLEHLPTREVGMSQVKIGKCVGVLLCYLKANFLHIANTETYRSKAELVLEFCFSDVVLFFS